MPTNKSWSITAVSPAGAAVTFQRQGVVLFAGGTGGGEARETLSPVEYLLIAAAGCLAISCRAVLARRQLAVGSVEVTATGEKSAEPPSRLGRIILAVRFAGGDIDPAGAASILAEAEKLCTVSNTLLGSPLIATHAVTERAAP
jgi:uncharacterized OsmC-like protein